MYTPILNSVLVEIEQDEWGKGNDDSMFGVSYSKGTVRTIGTIVTTNEHPLLDDRIITELMNVLDNLKDKPILWNEGAEAGTTFEDDGKLYGFIYWWDVRGVQA